MKSSRVRIRLVALVVCRVGTWSSAHLASETPNQPVASPYEAFIIFFISVVAVYRYPFSRITSHFNKKDFWYFIDGVLFLMAMGLVELKMLSILN